MVNKTKPVCPYCGDRGMKVLPQGEITVNGRPMANEVSVPCICSLNRYVSTKHKRLSGVIDVRAEDAIKVAKALPFTSAVFHGSEDLFLYVVKGFLVIHFPFNRRFAVLTGADIAEKYAMAQPNGVIPTVDLLTEHDLAIILCVARVNNKAIGPGTQEVIANRTRTRRPTWIYAPDQSALSASKEFGSDEGRGPASDLVSGWPVWNVDQMFAGLEGVPKTANGLSRKSQMIAADL